jgi:hypothetical protein
MKSVFTQSGEAKHLAILTAYQKQILRLRLIGMTF